jgi:hypothetical protein
MTHQELLAKIDLELKGPSDDCWHEGARALRAVVELHIPYGIDRYPELQSYCLHCDHLQSEVWPCPTIQAIQKELV